uniref:Gypsy retrotransposon integrase-like protein 1 n=1 Tax=Latimeria chalumnae TaxID=7897 RepID=H3A736_LATCH
YHTRLRKLAMTCNFTDVDREIKSQIVQTCLSAKLRRRALGDSAITITKLIEIGKAMEVSEAQASSIEREQHVINKMSRGKKGDNRQYHKACTQQYKQQPNKNTSNTKCRNCGGNFPHASDKTACPAFGKEWHNCKKANHFAACCRSKIYSITSKQQIKHRPQVNEIHTDNSLTSSDEDAYVYTIRLHQLNVTTSQKHPHFDIKINGQPLTVMADSGASINVIDEVDYASMNQQPKLLQTDVQVYPYRSQNPLPVLEKFHATIESATKARKETFYVVEGAGGSLLSWKTSQGLGLIKVVQQVTQDNPVEPFVKMLLHDYDDLFHGLGKLKNFQVTLHIDETVQPVVQLHRRIPFHICKELEKQLECDESLDVNEKTEGLTPWLSPVVPRVWEKCVCVCVDMRQANMAIKRERHITPTINETINDLNGTKEFSKLDLNQGYNQLELAPESWYITTFSTHVGLRRYKRLNFGISCAAEIFQNAIRETLSGLKRALNISDDIFVYGVSTEDHNTNLQAVLQRLRGKGLTLNKQKCIFNKSNLEFFGYVFTENGMTVDPKKIQAIHDPANATEVRSLLRVINFCCRFIPQYATLTEPLRELTKKDVPWKWSAKHEESLAKLRETLLPSVLAYFDSDKETEILVDASPVGLTAILAYTQLQHIVAFASRALTPIEQHYSQTEREALAVVWVCEHFHIYVYGRPFSVYTDHKPLIAIYGNPKSKPPARIERWSLPLQPYDVTVVYREGKDNSADYMSQHPAKDTKLTSCEEIITEEFVNYVALHTVPIALMLEDIKYARSSDPTLQAVARATSTGKWFAAPKDPQINPTTFKSSDGGFILQGNKLVMPKQAVELAHEGHQGLVKTKALIREKVWFPGIDKKVEEKTCQIATPETKHEPLMIKEVSIDFADLPTGEYLLVISDDYSRYPVVDIVKSTSTQTVIPRIDKIFSEFGTPKIVKSDNGPPFHSHEFKLFAKELGFHQRRITPYWPRVSGEVERFMKTIKKNNKNGNCGTEKLETFLRNYRATLHYMTGISPATALFGRPLKIKLPEISTIVYRPEMEKRDQKAKERMKAYADHKAYVKPSTLRKGDTVIVKH